MKRAISIEIYSRPNCHLCDDAKEAIAIVDTLGGVEEGEARIRLALYHALEANGRHVAAEKTLALARDRVLRQARAIGDAKLRRSFLECVHENAAEPRSTPAVSSTSGSSITAFSEPIDRRDSRTRCACGPSAAIAVRPCRASAALRVAGDESACHRIVISGA